MIQYGNAASFTVTMEGPFGTAEATPTKIGSISLPAADWKGAISPFSQLVAFEDVSVASKVDLTADGEQLEYFRQRGMAFMAENIDGVVTVWCYGDKPSTDLTLQATVTEVQG